ncbi:rifin PIR protein, putative [Plasmodium reichenowi]|uniref:Rifin PIR protein, putative n=1 Tax=Plasmodium reichenowi TaxID=5854 RepID=A0A2P9DSS2_PLARE|nr:rifin PIR protein, putative [Plasmodium reichenowi]
MKVHYINILLFALPLNILLYNQRNHKSTTPHYTPTTRLLCECELYAPVNYDNDPQMKKIMNNFNKETQERFHEYDERMKNTRQKCKEQCDKNIQKIILKDKLEKQMAEQLTTLETKIDTDDIPTCICEKSLADKAEKFCLNCGMNVGGVVTLSSGILGGIAEGAISVLQPLAITAAKEAAEKASTALATKAGMKAVMVKIEEINTACSKDIGFVNLKSIVSKLTYNNGDALVEAAEVLIGKARINPTTNNPTSFYNTVIGMKSGDLYIGKFGEIGSSTFQTTLESQTPVLTKAKVGAVEATYASYEIAIIASIVAIVVIVLIMVIIYKILRYRRKKK